MADKPSGGQWRVRSIVERKGVGLAEQISSSFPAVNPPDIHYVEPSPGEMEEGASEGTAAPEVLTVDPDDFASAMLSYEAELTGLERLPTRFIQFAQKAGVVVDMTTSVDVLASILASQFVLFAGPSGTGKSTLARQLQHFFADEDKAQIFEARRQWGSLEDLVGYYSVLGDQFATTPDTQKILDLHEASVSPLLGEKGTPVSGPPIMLVEEINLSAPEGYLAPVIHGLSGVRTPFLEWHLHSKDSGAEDETALLTLPELAMIGPYPRVLGTINVDANAHAPALTRWPREAALSCLSRKAFPWTGSPTLSPQRFQTRRNQIPVMPQVS